MNTENGIPKTTLSIVEKIVKIKCYNAAMLAFNIAGYPPDKSIEQATIISESTTI
jgi:hypothetical protein